MPRRSPLLLAALAASACAAFPAAASADEPLVLGHEARGDGSYVNFDMQTPLDSGARGTIVLKSGRHVVAKGRIELEGHDQSALPMLRKTKWGAKALDEHASLSTQAVAKVELDNDYARTFHARIKVYSRGASGFDGRYRGSAGISFEVENGFVSSLDKQTMAYCTSSSRNVVAYISQPYDRMDPVVKPNGTFAVEGHAGVGQTVKFSGKLKRSGKAKGYVSYSKYEFGVGYEGGYDTDYCFTGGKWTAGRTAK